jgi:hypothetical protein
MKTLTRLSILLMIGLFTASYLNAQDNTASFTGVVRDEKGSPYVNAVITATHVPSGTVYEAQSRSDGRYNIPAVKIGGPYTLVCKDASGKTLDVVDAIQLAMGQVFALDFTAGLASESLDGVTIRTVRNRLLNNQNTGASTIIDQEALNTMPTISRSMNDFLRMTPQARSSSVAATTGSGISLAGQDSRFNNLTIDGSIFNNSFGLASAPAGQTASTPISLDALQEISVNLAPYDVKNGGFTGGGINAVTRSGTNQIEGSVFVNNRNQSLSGKKANGVDVVKTDFNVIQAGFRLGGPIIKNKLFYFINAETETRNDPATSYKASRPGLSGTNITRVSASALDSLADFLKTRYGYDPGAYEDYSLKTYSLKYLAKFDWNINKNHRAVLRYNQLRSYRDVLISNSGAVNGNRRDNLNALNFANSNYVINNDIYSVIGELNSTLNFRTHNNFIVGFTANRDYRSSNGGVFPLVDIQQNGTTMTSFGYEPFTANNRLNTNTFQIQDNLNYYIGAHTITAGVAFERFAFENTFAPTYYGHYTFNSLNDFYRSANGDTGVSVRRYALTYSALPGKALPTASPVIAQTAAYLQDAFNVNHRLKITAGVRFDLPMYRDPEVNNPRADTMTFRDENYNPVKFSTAKLPNRNILWSPRVGFNWNAKGNRDIQVRGGTGLFAGRPAFVWISNQLSNNGVLTGSMRFDNSKNFQFSPDVERYIPANPTTPSSYNLALTDPDFKFPQVWRSDLGGDFKLPFGIVGTTEFMYTRTLNNVMYLNVNEERATGNFNGPDNRPVYPGLGLSGTAQNNALRMQDNITDAILLTNTNKGYNYSLTFKLEKPFSNNWSAMMAYNFSETKDLITAGSIAYSSWRDNRSVNGNNRPDLAFSDQDQRHRLIASSTYRLKYGSEKRMSTLFSMFFQTGNQGRYSMFYSNDMNGDQLANNDLMFIPNKAEDLKWKATTSGGVTYSEADQIAAFNNLLNSDAYLNANRGKYAARNGALLGWITTIDLSVQQNFAVGAPGKKHTLQLRLDFYNVGNMINNKWGVNKAVNYNNLLRYEGVDASNTPIFSLNRDAANKLISSVTNTRAALEDVWQMQFGVRYIFN